MVAATPACTGSSGSGVDVLITEFCAGETDRTDSYGQFSDWIELKNAGSEVLNLGGFGLSDDDRDPYRWTFPYLLVGPGERLLVQASGRDERDAGSELHTDFRISRHGEPVLLSSPDLQLVDRAPPRALPAGVSLGRSPDPADEPGWFYFLRPTPGALNGRDGRADLLAPAPGGLIINEVDRANSGEITDEDGDAPDWIELRNDSDQTIDLDGYTLSDDADGTGGWAFRAGRLEPGEFMVVFASGKDRSGRTPHTDFRLGDNEGLQLRAPSGDLLDLVPVTSPDRVGSHGRIGEAWRRLGHATPGWANSGVPLRSPPTEGETSRLVISEIMSLSAGNPLGGDWLELQNVSDEVIQLAGFGISDDPTRPYKCLLTAGKMMPETQVVIGLDAATDAPTQCDASTEQSLRVRASGEMLVLTSPEGREEHRLATGRLSAGVSVGLSPGLERRFYRTPTPGQPNPEDGLGPHLSRPRLVSTPIDDDTTRVIALAAEPDSTLRYKKGGSIPGDSSAVLDGPLDMKLGEVVRVRAEAPGRLQSDTVSLALIDVKQHALPVVSIVVDPRQMFDETVGMYSLGRGAHKDFPHFGANFWKDRELDAHVHIETAGTGTWVDQRVGLRVFGGYSRGFPKKALKIVARPAYGLPVVPMAPFPELGGYLPDELVLRAGGQDVERAVIRDVLATQLSASLDVEIRPYRPAVLYINGEYWGLYFLRPDLDPAVLGATLGTGPERITIAAGSGGRSSPAFAPVREYMADHDASSAEARAWVENEVDLDSFIDWVAVQIALANADIGNCMYWRPDGGRWRWILFDLDLAMSSPRVDSVAKVLGEGADVLPPDVQAVWDWMSQHEPYRQALLLRASRLYQEEFASQTAEDQLDALLEPLETEFHRDNERWNRTRRWGREVENLRAFFRDRPVALRRHYTRFFALEVEEADRLFPASPVATRE